MRLKSSVFPKVVFWGMLFISFPLFATHGAFVYGVGAADNAMAGSSLALPQDAFSAAYNPAGMSMVPSQIEADINVANVLRRYKAMNPGSVATGTHDSRGSYFIIPDAGFNKKIDDVSAYGFLLYPNARVASDYSSGDNVYGSGSAGVDLTQLFGNLYYSRAINPHFSWGLALILAGQSFSARGVGAFAPYSKNNTTDDLTNEGDDYSSGVGAQLSIQANLPYRILFAASYRPRIYMTKLDRYSNLLANSGELDIPATGSIGMAWHIVPSMAITAEFQRIWYADIPSLGNDVSRLNHISATPSFRLGASRGAGFGWSNMNIYSAGWEWVSSPKWTWRLGASYSNVPVHKEDVVFNILAPGVIKYHFTGGFSYQFNQRNQLSVYASYAPLNTLKGYNTLVPTQKIDLSMYQYQFGAGWSWYI